MSDYAPHRGDIERPQQLNKLLAYSRTLGAAYDTFVRIDFYITPSEVIFGEFCPFPWDGQTFTPFGDRYFGELWEKHVGEKV
ncbi:ATP-grasp fold amidoligase family protein [Alkalilimnicola ehrlichii]|uniref:ATP-grasp fold amidoligase family protein n=1 Tax=Alkalilimnicola ehrlichii TaxID=351052 RepID=UPI0021626E70|nr:ATP-grasp fold amidoligase family protein [Alkalilimnicola ehrlichii]